MTPWLWGSTDPTPTKSEQEYDKMAMSNYPNLSQANGIVPIGGTSSATTLTSTGTSISPSAVRSLQQMAMQGIAQSNVYYPEPPSGASLLGAIVEADKLPEPPILRGDEKTANDVARKLTGKYTEHDLKLLDYIFKYQRMSQHVQLNMVMQTQRFPGDAPQYTITYKGEQIWPPI